MKLGRLFRNCVWFLLFSLSVQILFAEMPAGGSKKEPLATKASKEISVTDAKISAKPSEGIAVNPFVGEIAVGVSLLITYGPQILALAATVATIAASVSVLVGTGKQSVQLVKSIGEKLKKMLSFLLGPLSMSTGTAKEGVNEVSKQLLNVAKFITNSISTPVADVQNHIQKSIEMSRDVENLVGRGKEISELVKSTSLEMNADLKRIVAGGEIQLFRDGARNVASRLEKQAVTSGGAFNQALENARMTTQALNGLSREIESALQKSGKSADEVTLHEIGVSTAKVSKDLIEARKHLVASNKILTDADKSTSGLHTEILGLLNGIKKDLEDFAKSKGIDKDQLMRTVKEQQAASSLENLKISPLKEPETGKAPNLSEEITFLVDEIDRITEKSKNQLKQFESSKSTTSSIIPAESSTKESDLLFNKKLAAYRNLVSVMAKEPGNKRKIQEAKAAFDLADSEYQEALSK